MSAAGRRPGRVPLRRAAAAPGRAGWPIMRRAPCSALALLALAALLHCHRSPATAPLVDHSDSMRPAIRAGDLVFTESVPAAALHRGEIVTFSDRALGGRLVTHRVVAIRRTGSRIEFLTRGDANPAAGELERSRARLAWPRRAARSLAGPRHGVDIGPLGPDDRC